MNDQFLGLTPDVVSQLIAAQFPDFADCEVSRFGAGDDHWLFSVGDEWLARFPQRLDRVAWLIREIEIISIASESLASSIPRFERVGEPTEKFPYPFVVYRKLPGVGADKSPVHDFDGLGRDIGRLLGKLHGIDPLRIPPTPTDWEGHTWGLLRAELVAVADLARPLLPPALLILAEPYLTGQVPEPIQDGPRRFIHNDICPDHVIIDPATGCLVGLIDFTDALIGDVVLDFVGLIGIGGYPFIRQVVENYDLVLGERFEVELVWLARTLTLKWLAEAAPNDSGDIPKHLSWVKYAFNN